VAEGEDECLKLRVHAELGEDARHVTPPRDQGTGRLLARNRPMLAVESEQIPEAWFT